jgi:hypothetical protein
MQEKFIEKSKGPNNLQRRQVVLAKVVKLVKQVKSSKKAPSDASKDN